MSLKRSLLEPIASDADFLFPRHHVYPGLDAPDAKSGAGINTIAREVIEADVVINVPKLKTHKKIGLREALKNLS